MNTRNSSTPIRVVHLLDGRHFGGAEQAVRRLVKASPSVGIEATAWCLSEGKLADYMRADGLPISVFPSTGRFDFRMLPALARQARRDGIQIIQAHTSRTHLIARIVSRLAGIKNVTMIHSPIALDENRSTGRHPLRAWVERAGRAWTDHIVCVSQEEAGRLSREEGVAPRKVSWIPNFAEPAAEPDAAIRHRHLAQWLQSQGLPAEAFTIVMIAQLRPRKGPEVLLRAYARLCRSVAEPTALIMIGNDEFTGASSGYMEGLKRLSAQLGLEGKVRFTGFMTDPWAVAGGADLMALPSLFGEGLPLVLIEAMSYGIAIAASDILGNRELARPGVTGWLHPPGDDEALARHLAEAVRDRQATRAMGEAGRTLYQTDYTSKAVMARFRDLYDRLLGTQGAI